MKIAVVSPGVFALLSLCACSGSEAAEKAVEWADKTCACKDTACVDGVKKEQEAWIAKHGAEVHGSEAAAKQVAEATKEMLECRAKASVAAAAASAGG